MVRNGILPRRVPEREARARLRARRHHEREHRDGRGADHARHRDGRGDEGRQRTPAAHEQDADRGRHRDRRGEQERHLLGVAPALAHPVQRRHRARPHPDGRSLRADEVVVRQEPVRVQVVQVAQARHDELLAARVPDAVAHHAGPSSAQIASATRRPSTADETIPPA